MKHRISDFSNSTEFFKTVESIMPCIKYRPEDFMKYELIYYGDIEPCEHQNYLRLWIDWEDYKYIATINDRKGKLIEIKKSMTVDEVIQLFSKDIKRIKDYYNKQRLDKIKQDFQNEVNRYRIGAIR